MVLTILGCLFAFRYECTRIGTELKVFVCVATPLGFCFKFGYSHTHAYIYIYIYIYIYYIYISSSF